MNSTQIEKYLDAPHLINEQDVLLLKKSVNDFPYVGVFQRLYVKGLHNTKSVYYGAALQRAALVVNDRSKLYEIIHKEAPQTVVTKVDAPSFEDVDVILKDNHIKSDKNKIEQTPNIKVDAENKLDVVLLNKEENSEEKKELQAKNDIEVMANNEIAQPIVVDKELESLENDILIEAINNTIQLDVNDITKETELDSKDEELTLAPIKEAKKVISPTNFSDWLQVLDSGKTISVNKTEKTNLETLKSPTDLINQFISLKTNRLKSPKEYKSSKELNAKSIEEKGEFVTETLANVYASQGSYLKAIKIYEQLSLTIPEKNTFFASRIRFLREKMEYDK